MNAQYDDERWRRRGTTRPRRDGHEQGQGQREQTRTLGHEQVNASPTTAKDWGGQCSRQVHILILAARQKRKCPRPLGPTCVGLRGCTRELRFEITAEGVAASATCFQNAHRCARGGRASRRVCGRRAWLALSDAIPGTPTQGPSRRSAANMTSTPAAIMANRPFATPAGLCAAMCYLRRPPALPQPAARAVPRG